jgi:hypothetical protein
MTEPLEDACPETPVGLFCPMRQEHHYSCEST